MYRQYIRKDNLLLVIFAPHEQGMLYDTLVAPPEAPPGVVTDMTVSCGPQGRITSIEFWNTESQPETMIQLYDPFKDILMVLFTERTPEPEVMPDLTPTFHDNIMLYIEDNKVIGMALINATKILMTPKVPKYFI